MKLTLSFLLSLLIFSATFSQDLVRYTNNNGESHLSGNFKIEDLEKDPEFKKWFVKNYTAYKTSEIKEDWANRFKDVTVQIFMGTWCSDSKKWVPKFVKLWDELGLKRTQLNFVALYDSIEGKYKQSPNGQEKDWEVHRLPTIIFNKDDQELGRIIESPINSLRTDVAQIALGVPSEPNYRTANRMIQLLKTTPIESLMSDSNSIEQLRKIVKNSSELNTLARVYLESNRIDKALVVFYFNTQLFENESKIYANYAKALTASGQIKKAIKNYKKALILDGGNIEIKKQLKKLRGIN
ncbi:tetratricopeptide repeat protein [Aquimarina agarivorans]|uniref:tetratricopeptide repeat protein n=1 Tax=Aquimarina agarivorans TaxID=980584 RepID=UPI000248E6AC|nr:hypothetical protein [Aquimarina agarivorans]